MRTASVVMTNGRREERLLELPKVPGRSRAISARRCDISRDRRSCEAVAIGALMASPTPLFLKVGLIAFLLAVKAQFQHIDAFQESTRRVFGAMLWTTGSYLST